MSDIYELTAETRTQIGKGSCRRLRRLENKVPAIVYGGDKNPEAIILDHNKFVNSLENETFYTHILTLSIDGKKEKVVLKDLHRHPSRPKILHADFLRINPKSALTMNIPLHFVNADTAVGVKEEGGVVSHLMSEVEVKCLPTNLPEYIEVDLANVKLGQNLHLSDLKLPKNVELTALAHGKDGDQAVVSIHKPHVVQEEAPTIAAIEPASSTPKAEDKTEG